MVNPKKILMLAFQYMTLKQSSPMNWYQGGYYLQFRLDGKLPVLLGDDGLSVIRDLPYGTASKLQTLDLVIPSKNGGLPVVVFIHGGGWRAADKSKSVHVHQNFCYALARHGFLVANINHRLSPRVRHPEHIGDVALALCWLREQVGAYGGDADRLFLAGHSSGAHLACLLVLDGQYLIKAGLPPHGWIKGVIGIAGVYDLPAFAKEDFARKVMVLPAFDEDEEIWRNASPVNHIHKQAPPMLLFNAKNEPLTEGTQLLAHGLGKAGVLVEREVLHGTNHFTILTKAALEGDPLMNRTVGFIKRQLEQNG